MIEIILLMMMSAANNTVITPGHYMFDGNDTVIVNNDLINCIYTDNMTHCNVYGTGILVIHKVPEFSGTGMLIFGISFIALISFGLVVSRRAS